MSQQQRMIARKVQYPPGTILAILVGPLRELTVAPNAGLMDLNVSFEIGLMRLLHTPESKLKLSEALRQMSDALDILDDLGAPGEIGTSLDLAVARLEQF